MPLIRVNGTAAGLRLHQSPADPIAALRRQALAGSGPVIVMVHGFRFRPGHARACPHAHIFSLDDTPCRKQVSWPRRLGFGAAAPDAGLGIAFGWDSRGMIRDAYARAADAGAALARVIRTVREAAPHRPMHAIAHSLGARVALQALPYLQHGDIGRIISLNGAEFSAEARAALAAGAGPAAELIAVRGRENAGYELMLERFVDPAHRGDRALGRASLTGPRLLDLCIDRPVIMARLAALGFPLGPSRRIICHWSPYLRDGALTLYAALMRESERLPLDLLRIPTTTAAAPAAAQALRPLGWHAPS